MSRPPFLVPVAELARLWSDASRTVRAFMDALDGDVTETEAALAADNERPLVHLCARPGRITAAELAEQAGGLVGAYSPYAAYLPEGAPGDLPAAIRCAEMALEQADAGRIATILDDFNALA